MVDLYLSLALNRRMASDDEVRSYEDALTQLAAASRVDVARLVDGFDDTTDHPEVMDGLLRLVESLPPQTEVTALFSAYSSLAERAPMWTEILVSRLLNDEKSREPLIEGAQAGDADSRARFLRLLDELSRDQNRDLAGRAASVLASLTRK